MVGTDAFNSMLPHFKNSLQDPKWRIRSQGFEEIAELAIYFNNIEIFTKYLEPLYFMFLKEKACIIRELAM